MLITDVKVHKVTNPYNGVIGYASLIFDNSLRVGDILIVKKTQGAGLYLRYPQAGRAAQSHLLAKPLDRSKVGYEPRSRVGYTRSVDGITAIQDKPEYVYNPLNKELSKLIEVAIFTALGRL